MRRRVYFDADVFDHEGYDLFQYCSCEDSADGESPFDTWCRLVGKETSSALRTDNGASKPLSIRVVITFTHFFNYLPDGSLEETPTFFADDWTPYDMFVSAGPAQPLIKDELRS